MLCQALPSVNSSAPPQAGQMPAPPLLTIKFATVSGPLCTLPPDWGCLRPQLGTSSLHVQAWGCLGTPHTFLHAPSPPMASWLHVGFLLSLCKPGAGRAPAECPCHCTTALAPPRPQAQWPPLSTCPAQAQPIGAASREVGGGEQGHHTLSLVLAYPIAPR